MITVWDKDIIIPLYSRLEAYLLTMCVPKRVTECTVLEHVLLPLAEKTLKTWPIAVVVFLSTALSLSFLSKARQMERGALKSRPHACTNLDGYHSLIKFIGLPSKVNAKHMQDQSMNALRACHWSLKDSLTWYISFWKNSKHAKIHLVQSFSI